MSSAATQIFHVFSTHLSCCLHSAHITRSHIYINARSRRCNVVTLLLLLLVLSKKIFLLNSDFIIYFFFDTGMHNKKIMRAQKR